MSANAVLEATSTVKILEINNASIDSTVKEITMLVHKIDCVNGNGLDFKKEYVEEFLKTIVDKPVVCKYHPEKDDLGTHEEVRDPKTGKIVELNTICIGNITDAWIDKIVDLDTEALFAKAVIWSYKFPKVMECIEKLHEQGASSSSVEVEITEYGPNPTKEYRYGTKFSYFGNCLLGSTILPADDNAGILSVSDKEIATAIRNDLKNIQKGVPEVSKQDPQFNKGFETRYHGIETNALKFSEVRNQIYNTINPIHPQDNYRKYNYSILDIYTEYVVVEEWDDYSVLWKIDYKIENDIVILSPKESWTKGSLGFIPEGVDIAKLQKEIEDKNTEMGNKLNALNKEAATKMDEQTQELNKAISTKDQELASQVAKINELEEKINELNSLIVSQESTKKDLENEVTELNSQIGELKPFKDQVERLEKDKHVAELNSKYSALLEKETFQSERVQNALNELNVTELNNIIVEELAKIKANGSETEINNKEQDIVINASKSNDLVDTDVLSKFGINL